MTLDEKLEQLPQSPGVYQFFGKDGVLLYIGKAKVLRNRVRSYFQDSRNHDARIRVMISKIHDLQIFLTHTEAEALVLEKSMIKEHHPRYNIMFRDDKTYPYVCITAAERPRVYPTRTLIRDGSRYLGPYNHVGHMQRSLEAIGQAFHLCTCAVSPRSVDRNRGEPRWGTCLDAYLGGCSENLPQDIYRDTIQKLKKVLSGRTGSLIKELQEEMGIAAAALDYESAAKIRDTIASLQTFSQKMNMVAAHDVDRDLVAVERNEEIGEACGVVFRVREGKLIGQFHSFMKNIDGLPDAQILQTFLEETYTGLAAEDIPPEILLSHPVPEEDTLRDYLREMLGRNVEFSVPQRGEKRQLIRIACTNARNHLGQRELELAKSASERIPKSVQDLQRYVGLRSLPRRIECFDNSNIQGSDAVAAMVSFADGQPRKKEYKRFTIKTVVGPDDFASMQEIVTRRYRRLAEQDLPFPDLIVIDGGKGQLNAALEALRDLGLQNRCEIIGLAKRLEEVFVPGNPDPIMIPKTSPALRLLQQARDEAHRFAITFHRAKRSRRTVRTDLTRIPGVGPKTAQQLLSQLGSVKRIREASLEDLQQVAGPVLGATVHRWFQEGADAGAD